MDSLTLNRAFQYVDNKYLDIVEQERVRKVRRHTGSRQGLIAACIVGLILILGLPAVAIAANWFGLRDLIIPRTPYSSGIGASPSEGMTTDTDVSLEGDEDVRQFIGFSGYQGSAEAQALAEWQAFLADYDSDHAILNEIGNGATGVDSRYDLYYVYTQDMADKLEEIVQKYHLKLHTQINVVTPEELEHHVGGKFLPGRYGKYGGYIYEDGSFRFDGHIFWDDAQVAYQFARTVKGTFDEVTLNVGNAQDFQEFSYTTEKGETVMIAMGEDVSLIWLDAESCFISVNFVNWYNSKITKELLMEVADNIDFALLKDVRVPEMRGDSIPYGTVKPETGTEETVVYPEEDLSEPGEKKITAKEDYREILLGKEDFTNIDIADQYRKINLMNLKEVVSSDPQIEARAIKFAMIDLDGDGEMEVVLWIQVNQDSYYGFEILYCRNEEIYGFTLVYRQFCELKTDGTFYVSGGAADTRVCRLQFSENGYEMENLSDTGKPQEEKKNVEWYDLTEENIAQFLQKY